VNSVIHLKALSDPSVAPCLVLIDMQREYVADRRLIALSETDAALTNCRRALEHARSRGFPVAFLRQVTRSAFFNPLTFSGWIEGFEPTRADIVFDRAKPSCYSNETFAGLMRDSGGHFVFAGFAGETTCLSTAIEAYHRDHRFTYLMDAGLASAEVQDAVSRIVGLYGETLDTRSWIARTSNRPAFFESTGRR
jgi:nicotinamidase-related amidase